MERTKTLVLRALMTCMVMFFALDISAQSTINGTVNDATGEPIIGASVVVKGATGGGITDIDGNFKVQCKAGATLTISYIGFVTQELPAKDGMVVTLQEDNTTLNEVVVVGYGSLAKKEISSSVVQISRDQFNQGAVSDPMGLVAGKVAGLNVNLTADANPNSMADIQVRGATSLTAANGPLIVIDGIAGGDLRNVAAQDVESITVLKDAGSAAIYGTRGANGVILVTTKKGSGQEGVTSVTYDSYIALNFAKSEPSVLSPEEFRRSRRGADLGYNTDWYDLITRDVAYNLNQYVSIDGTTKNGYYGASLNYKKSNGLDIRSKREEYGGRFVIEQRALDNYLQFNSSLTARKVHEEWGNDGLFDTALSMNPTWPVKNADGTYYQATSPTNVVNPYSQMVEIDNNGDRMYVLGNADVKLNILRTDRHNLNTSVSYALQYNDLKSHYYAPSYTSVSFWGGFNGTANIKYQKWVSNRFEWLANYILSLNDHEIKAVLGYSWERSTWEQMYEENSDFTYDTTKWHLIGSGSYLKEGKANMYAGKTESTLIGFFGRVNYNWRDMIFASASLRHEGSTKFGADKKWGNFPSISLAWEATKTPGLEALKTTFQSLKPRISYGVTGRSDFDAYRSLATYSNRGAYLFDGQWVTGYAPSANANPQLGWEKSTAFNIGVDFVAFDSRLRGSVEYFDRRSKDLLYEYTAPQPPFVYNTILVNVGTTKNTGFEIVADFDVLRKTPVKWTTGINYSYGTTKLTKLSSDIYKASYLELYQKPGIGTSEYFFRVAEGSKIGQFYGYKYAGHDADGNMLVYNKDGEAVPTTQVDASDKDYIGNGAPSHFLSWNNSLRYKNWDMSFMFRGVFGFDIFNMRKYNMGLQGSNGGGNVLRSAYLDDKDIITGGGVISDFFLEKGDYFKFENITVGYTFTPKNRKLLDNLRVYLTAKNLFTITGYSGNDPSIVPATGITPGVDVTSAYPTATQLSLGVSLKFH